MARTHRGDFASDLERFLHPKAPLALARFHDGEYHILRGEPYKAKSNWSVYEPSWLRDRLLAALEADLEGYWVGISPPCCFPQATAYFRSQVNTHLLTYATVFWFANFSRTRKTLYERVNAGRCATVGCTARCDYRIPANGVASPWDLDGLVGRLLDEERPILLAAGPSACIIAHEYWKRAPADSRQTILDVGAAMDPLLHGKPTRHFQEGSSNLRTHRCSWTQSAPWSPSMGRKVKGDTARRAKRRTRFGGKVKDK